MREIWRVLPEFPHYQASTLGRIKSTHGLRPRIMQAVFNKKTGYFHVGVFNRETKTSTTTYVHHFVLRAFKGKRPKGYHGCHLDGDKTNNKLSNLKWATPAENASHRILHRTEAKCERAGSAKLSNEEAFTIQVLARKKVSPVLIASIFGISRSNVSSVGRKVFFKHLRVVEDFIIKE